MCCCMEPPPPTLPRKLPLSQEKGKTHPRNGSPQCLRETIRFYKLLQRGPRGIETPPLFFFFLQKIVAAAPIISVHHCFGGTFNLTERAAGLVGSTFERELGSARIAKTSVASAFAEDSGSNHKLRARKKKKKWRPP